ncbi:hypothetical protein J6P92_08440 [bacterium]|nr:hypothetical protein [bacterium]
MAETIKVFENSLRDYLVNVQQDSYNSTGKIEYRYNNLKVYMEPKKNKTPHFAISLGISEVRYTISPVEKMSGSLGGNDEKYIVMWATRPNINGELKKHWAYLIKALSITVDEKTSENESLIVNKVSKETKDILEEEAAQIASEIITSAGVLNKDTDNTKKDKSE